MKKDFFQRRAYAARRMNTAVDRVILATSLADYKQACKWVDAWRIVTNIRKPEQASASATKNRKLRLVDLSFSHIGNCFGGAYQTPDSRTP